MLITGTDVVGYTLLGIVWAVGGVFAVLTTPNKPGVWNMIFFKILIPVFWPVALYIVFCMQPRPDYEGYSRKSGRA